MDKYHLRVSVRNLVAFSLKEDAKWSFSSYRHANEGTLAHGKLQAINREGGNYTSEVYLSHSFEVLDCIIDVVGRADGVWRQSTDPCENSVILQEIKTSSVPLSQIEDNYSDSHWAQGKCYAFLLCELEDLEQITVRLTYYDYENEVEKSFDKTFEREKLARFFKTLIYPYVVWALSQKKWKEERNSSINAITFPYNSFRKGQKLLAYNVYKSIEYNKRLFAQAPTGIGKTMGVLYPAIKSLGEGKLDRMFYATAKTTTRGIAETAYNIIAEQGLRLKVLTLTAKEKMCLNDVKDCRPEKCAFIQGYISRSRKVVRELLKKRDFFPREEIHGAGLQFGICPFELSLDLSLSCDLIICDYNYIFDPRVYLRRFFEQKGREEYLIMVDEAHNLFDRAREMYSSEIKARELIDLAKEIKNDLPHIRKDLISVRKALSAFEKSSGLLAYEAAGTGYNSHSAPPSCLMTPILNFIKSTEIWVESQRDEKPYTDKLVTLFFDLIHFRNILDIFSDKYRTLLTGTKTNFSVKLLCLDPSTMLDENMASAKSTILFSATLSPLWYFKHILGGREEDITIKLPSPFPRENILVYNEDTIETKYRYRSKYISTTAKAIYDWSISHQGNFMVFFPSYNYLQDVLNEFNDLLTDTDNFEVLCQDRAMDEASRDDFLSLFNNFGDTNRIAFCVMGGIFSEGIDLVGDKLTGVVIVGVGLPQVSPELEIMREYYQGKNSSGFSYSYVFPGINKVLQASGRLIRSESDVGALLLIDSRFAESEYLKLLPDEWHPITRASTGISPRDAALNFWKSKKSPRTSLES